MQYDSIESTFISSSVQAEYFSERF